MPEYCGKDSLSAVICGFGGCHVEFGEIISIFARLITTHLYLIQYKVYVRTHTCGELRRKTMVRKQPCVRMGYIVYDKGGMIWVDLRDNWQLHNCF